MHDGGLLRSDALSVLLQLAPILLVLPRDKLLLLLLLEHPQEPRGHRDGCQQRRKRRRWGRGRGRGWGRGLSSVRASVGKSTLLAGSSKRLPGGARRGGCGRARPEGDQTGALRLPHHGARADGRGAAEEKLAVALQPAQFFSGACGVCVFMCVSCERSFSRMIRETVCRHDVCTRRHVATFGLVHRNPLLRGEGGLPSPGSAVLSLGCRLPFAIALYLGCLGLCRCRLLYCCCGLPCSEPRHLRQSMHAVTDRNGIRRDHSAMLLLLRRSVRIKVGCVKFIVHG